MNLRPTLNVGRSIISLLAPMTGDVSTGTVTLTATGPNVVLPQNTFGFSIVDAKSNAPTVSIPGVATFNSSDVLGAETIADAISPDLLVKTTAETTVTSSGVSVPFRTILGGPRANLPTGTRILLDPPVDGLEFEGVVDAPGFTGGTTSTKYASAKTVRLYEGIGPEDAAEDLFRSGTAQFPALVLIWNQTGDREEAGRDRYIVSESWTLAVIASRLDSDTRRRSEASAILDEAEELLCARCSTDGFVFSAPAPLLIRGRRRVKYGSNAYIYALSVTTTRGIERREHRTFHDWKQTKISGTTNGVPLINNVIVEQP